MASSEAAEFKNKGNDLFKEKKFEEAIKMYNKAITLDPDNAAYYSNRSGAWSSKGNHESALKDGERCIEKDATFIKGYSRKGKALFDLGRWDEAEAAYKEGLVVEPANDGCKVGVAGVQAAKQRKKQASKGKPFEFMGINKNNIVQKVTEKVKSGGKIQMYLVMFMGYFLFTKLSGRGKSSSSPSPSSSHDVDDDVRGEGGGLPARSFVEVGGHWMSFVQTVEPKAEATLLLLHSTARSAEGDYGVALPRLAAAGRRTVRLLAPDRPCHGFSPCPASGEPESASWLKGLLAKRGGDSSQLWVAAVGRDAARQALALASARKEATQLWLLSPRALAPSAASMGQAAELKAWLEQRKGETAASAADAAHWAVAASRGGEKPAFQGSLGVADLPRGCKVTLLYGEDDEEDEETRAALEAEGVPFETRAAGELGLFDLLVDEVEQQTGPTAGAATAGAADDDDDE